MNSLSALRQFPRYFCLLRTTAVNLITESLKLPSEAAGGSEVIANCCQSCGISSCTAALALTNSQFSRNGKH